METDPNLLLALLAVRTLGGQSVPASAEAIKALKKPIKEAVEKGWLKEDKITEQVPAGPGKKPRSKKVPVVLLTEEGERVLKDSASPEALAAAQARQLGDAIQGLESDRQALRTEVLAALAPKKTGTDKEETKLAREVASLAGKVAKLAESMADLAHKVEDHQNQQARQGTDPLLSRIDEGFGRLEAAIRKAIPTSSPGQRPPETTTAPTAPQTTRPEPAPPVPTQAEKPPPSPPTLPDVLRQAYLTLCRFKEFQEGMVELPRLYHEAHKARPDLTVDQFKKEILDLESRRALDLHIRNEVHDAPEPEKAITRNERLYYYAYWPPLQ